jgi:hypothetical protein
MSPAATFLPRIAFALRASRVAALPPLTHAAAPAGWFERLSSQKSILERCYLHKVLYAIYKKVRTFNGNDSPPPHSLTPNFLPLSPDIFVS